MKFIAIYFVLAVVWVPVSYFVLNGIANIWEAVFKRPFTIRRFIVPFLILGFIVQLLNVLLLVLQRYVF